jgi:hypothetical protein
MVDERVRLQGLGARRRAVSSAALVAVLALVAAGCGGSSDKKANEAYAKSVCSAIGSWEQQVKTIATSFNGTISKANLQTKLTQVSAATTQLATQIKAVPPPNTSDGQAAKQQLDQFSKDASAAVSSAKSAVAQIPSSASVAEIAAALIPLAPQVQALQLSGQSAATALKNQKGSLASAFKSTASCQSLGVG